MFNSDLYKISEDVFKRHNKDDIKKRNIERTKKLLEIIKTNCSYINEDGIVTITISSTENKEAYDILYSIITSGLLNYYEQELALYFVENEHVDDYSGSFRRITFVWNCIKYAKKNECYARRLKNDLSPR